MQLPTVKLVFDEDVQPVIKTFTYPTSYVHVNHNNVILEDDTIFFDPITLIPNPNKSIGYVATYKDNNSNIDHIDSSPLMIPDITSTVHTTSSNGIYEMQLQPYLQNDGGANRSVTNCKHILYEYKDIQPYPIGGINNSDPAIYCTGHGYIKWYSPSKHLILISCYFSSQASGTIISPTDIVCSHIDTFSGWQMTTNIDNSTGIFTLLARDGISHIKFPTFMKNNLWYHHLHVTESPIHNPTKPLTSIVRSLTYHATYELWHHRLGHPSKSITDKFHAAVIGVPPLKCPKFHACGSCLRSKFHNKSLRKKPNSESCTKIAASSTNSTYSDSARVGQFLHMDYGFVRGSDYTSKDNDGKLVTSIDKYRAYLLVIDKKSRFIWIFLTRTKEPPISQVQSLLNIFEKCNVATITTDQGGELASSRKFTNMISKTHYILTPTGAYSSAQNGLAEVPNKHLAQIMRSLLYSSGLGSKFWSYALRHSVYLKNRWPHSSLDYITPYEALHGQKPSLTHLRTFGSIVHIKSSAKRYMKLDPITSEGLFMTYSGSDKIIIAVDRNGTNERRCTHVSYDEAHMSTTTKEIPPMGLVLQQAGYHSSIPEKPISNNITVKIKLLSPTATMPTKGTPGSAAYDLYSSESITINPKSQALIKTDIAIQLPPNHYGQIKSRSGLALKHRIHVQAGVIDSDYRGNIKILLSNESNIPYRVDLGSRIAQMIVLSLPICTLEQTDELTFTDRNKNGFGSTGVNPILPRNTDNGSPPAAAAAKIDSSDQHLDDDDIKYNVVCSPNPFMDTETISIPIRGSHPTQGLVFSDCETFKDKVIIKYVHPGTSPRNIKRWIHRIKNSHLIKINNINIKSTQQATAILADILSQNKQSFKITVSNDQRQSIHHDQGIPMMYFDQLATISKHLQNIRFNKSSSSTPAIDKLDKSSDQTNKYLLKMLHAVATHRTVRAAKSILPKNRRSATKLTRRKLRKQPDWNDWLNSEFKQLDQYKEQKMFSAPCPLPPGANVLDLLWTYNVKVDGTKKARCVCNGQPKFKGTVIFGYTFAKMLDHVGSRIFWATVASKNLIVRGADASNAFAEANAPEIPLYVRIDAQYKDWYKQRYNKDIPDNYVLPVNKALQGHPESSRLWAKHMDRILKDKFHFKATTHEGCLYKGTYKGEDILFLRQVDDFAVATKNEQTAIDLINEIDSYMTIDIKDLGRLNRYNGVDITQTKYYVKLSNETYVNKLLEEHDWLLHDDTISNIPIPTKNEATFNQRLETAKPPSDASEQQKLQLEMGINYRQAIGELIFLMVTCRPDISYPLIKLSQYSSNPAAEHYHAVKHLFKYIKATKSEGIYFWRRTARNDLPEGPLPIVTESQYNIDPSVHCDDPDTIHSTVDSDWAGDSTHRRSVSGIIIKFCGGTIFYKTKFQDTIALSSTEAEFTAACDAGKAILYVRSILDEIGVPQNEATTLFIDNNGALLMGNAQQPTRRTRHMDIKHFSLLDWIERELIIMQRINTSDNSADALTKSLGRTLHYRHTDYILGKLIPSYAAAYNLKSPTTV